MNLSRQSHKKFPTQDWRIRCSRYGARPALCAQLVDLPRHWQQMLSPSHMDYGVEVSERRVFQGFRVEPQGKRRQ